MELIWTAGVAMIAVYLLYEGATWYYGLKNPPPPYDDEDPVLGKVATVTEGFSTAAESAIATGVVELNGTTWMAESADLSPLLKVGDRCRVGGRDGLRLIVEAI